MAIIGAPIQQEDSYGVANYPATFGEGFDASVDQALATNPITAGKSLIEGGFDRASAARTPGAYVLSPDEANQKYGDLGLKFDAPVSPGYANTLAEKKRAEIERAQTMERAPKGFFAQAGYFAGGLGASAIDPINIGSAFIPIIGEERMASLVASTGLRTARFIKGGVEGAVGAAVVEPLVYAGAQENQYNYDLADSLINVAFGTVLGGGLHFAGGEIHDAWRARKTKVMAEEGVVPPAANISEAVDNLTPMQRMEVMRTAVGQAVKGEEINVAHLLPESTLNIEITPKEEPQVKMAQLERELNAPETTPERKAEITQEMNTLAEQAAPAKESPKIYADVDKRVETMREDRATQRLASLDKKVAAGLEMKPKELYEREALSARLRPADLSSKPAAQGGGNTPPLRASERASITKEGRPVLPDPKLELETPDSENTILRAKALPEEVEQAIADLDAMLQVEKKAGTLTEGELAGLDAADEAAKQADAAGRGLLAAATCIFRKA